MHESAGDKRRAVERLEDLEELENQLRTISATCVVAADATEAVKAQRDGVVDKIRVRVRRAHAAYETELIAVRYVKHSLPFSSA